jgi:DNA-binding Lrp family transcriptional regulator
LPEAYVLINVDAGAEESVLEHLKTIKGVEEAYVSYGAYDIVVKVKAETMEELKDEVSHRVRTINQVRSTLTLILIEE